MQHAVEECEQSEHPPESYQRVYAEDLSQRCDCNSQAEKDERQHSSGFGSKLERVWTNTFMVEIPKQQHERHKGVHEDNEFREGHCLKVLHQIHSLVKRSDLLGVTIK